MDRYIGLDVHMQSCTMVVVGPSGRRLSTQVVETNGKALVEAIKSVPGRRHVVMEEGAQSAWLHELLSPHVEKVLVTQPLKRRGLKDDLRDAMVLAEGLRTGSLPTVVYKAPRWVSGLRAAVHSYTMVTKDLVRLKNRIRAIYRSRGLMVKSSIYQPDGRGQCAAKLPASQRVLMELLHAELDAVEKLRGEAEYWLRKEAKRHPAVGLLKTVPGMGTIRAAVVVAIVVTPERFRTKRQFWSYCGLGIVTQSSSDWVQQGGRWVRAQTVRTRGLNRNRNPLLKWVFKGAATTVVHSMKEHPLHRDYQQMLQRGTKPQLAKLTLARRIASVSLALWKKKEVYDPAKHCRKKG